MGWEGLGKIQNRFQKYCGNVLGKPKMKHEKGIACFIIPKKGVGRAWKHLETLKMKYKKGFGCLMAPKNGVGRV